MPITAPWDGDVVSDLAHETKAVLKRALAPLFWKLPYETRRYLYRARRPESFRSGQERRRELVTGEAHSYRPFDENKCIFIHVPKCAGISVSMGLFGNLSGGHGSARTYSLVFDREEFATYFKFTFVRNPWDRLASGYHYLRDGVGLDAAGPDSAGRLREIVRAYPDFDGFVKGWVNRKNVNSLFLFAPQYRYICIKNREPVVDFIGFYENIVGDYERIRWRIGVGSSLSWLNRTPDRAGYMGLYSATTRKIVEEVYAEDIEMFGYSFDHSNLERQLAHRDRAWARGAPAIRARGIPPTGDISPGIFFPGAGQRAPTTKADVAGD